MLFLGFSTNHEAVQLWTQAASCRAHARMCIERFLLFGTNSLHPDLLPSQIEKDENDVKCVYQLNTSLFINPFSDNMEIISLSSGLIPIKRAAAHMVEAESKGKTEVLKFIDEQFVNQSVDFFSPLKRLKLGSYTTILEKPVQMKSGKVVQSSTQSDIVDKIAIIQ